MSESQLTIIEIDEIISRPWAPLIERDESGEVTNLIISPLKVMKSNAGYYVGRSCKEPGFELEQPYCRESGYFKSEERAKLALAFLLALQDQD